MAVRIIGADKVGAALGDLADRVNDQEIVTSRLATGMRQYAHVLTGTLRDSIGFSGNVAFADAPYAGYEADRGGDHAFDELAIDNLDMEELADALVGDF